MSSIKPTEWGMLILLSIFWGVSFFFTEIALRDFQPFTVVFLRVTMAALILLGVVYINGQRMPGSLRVWGAFLVMGALNNAIPFSLIVWGQTRIDSGVAVSRNDRFTLVIKPLIGSSNCSFWAVHNKYCTGLSALFSYSGGSRCHQCIIGYFSYYH